MLGSQLPDHLLFSHQINVAQPGEPFRGGLDVCFPRMQSKTEFGESLAERSCRRPQLLPSVAEQQQVICVANISRDS